MEETRGRPNQRIDRSLVTRRTIAPYRKKDRSKSKASAIGVKFKTTNPKKSCCERWFRWGKKKSKKKCKKKCVTRKRRGKKGTKRRGRRRRKKPRKK